jgi:ribosomal protein S18 acetylase RimI-like enzyme
MDDLVIRAARSGDGPQLARIWREFAAYYAELDDWAFQIPREDGLAEWLEQDLGREASGELTLVAILDGEVAGFAAGRVVDAAPDADRQLVADHGRRRLAIDVVATAERFRRRGVGAALVGELETWGRAHGAELALAETYHASPVSIPFWEDGVGYGRRSVKFVKRLR